MLSSPPISLVADSTNAQSSCPQLRLDRLHNSLSLFTEPLARLVSHLCHHPSCDGVWIDGWYCPQAKGKSLWKVDLWTSFKSRIVVFSCVIRMRALSLSLFVALRLLFLLFLFRSRCRPFLTTFESLHVL